MFLISLISLLYNCYFIFRRRYLVIKKPILKTYPQIHDFE